MTKNDIDLKSIDINLNPLQVHSLSHSKKVKNLVRLAKKTVH